MSTLLHDLDSHAALVAAVPPQTLSADGPLAAVELPDADGPAFAVLMVGTAAIGTSLTVAVEESDGGGSWAAVPGGSIAGSLSAGLVSAVTFCPSKRYLRCNLTFTGPGPEATLGVLLGRQRKVV